MDNYRYEDYSQIKEQIPCIVNHDIIRTKNELSYTANWHHNLEIQLCCEGNGFVTLDGKQSEISAGDIIVVNYDTIHFTGTDGHLKYHCIIIDNDFCLKSGINCSDIRFESIFRDQALSDTVSDIVSAFKNADDICYKAKLQYLVLKILILLRTHHTKNISAQKHNKYFKGVKDAISYIQNNYDKKITLSALAKETYIDKYTLSKKFKEYTGITVVEYINSYRCNTAMKMIQNGEQICTAAKKCGFNNVSFFTKTFKKHTGHLPLEYKRQSIL